MARLRVFPDGWVAAWQGFNKAIVETRIPRDDVTSLVNWLVDEKNAGQRTPLEVTQPDGKAESLFFDPLPSGFWDQYGSRVAINRDGRRR